MRHAIARRDDPLAKACTLLWRATNGVCGPASQRSGAPARIQSDRWPDTRRAAVISLPRPRVCSSRSRKTTSATSKAQRARRTWLPAQLVEQRLGVLQVACVEALGEPAVYFGEHRTRFVAAAVLREQPREAHRRTQFQRFRALLSAISVTRSKQNSRHFVGWNASDLGLRNRYQRRL
jgi:hypothetical protein